MASSETHLDEYLVDRLAERPIGHVFAGIPTAKPGAGRFVLRLASELENAQDDDEQ
ncbi:MAG: hypothetical protein JRH17_14560 [Deltaproteobacteria bacterium]|nr:hypothetical protein [Deltaproteobacteria bacterium]